MKKILKVLAVFVLVIIAFVGFFLYKFSKETSKMTAVNTGQVTGNVYAIKNDFVNMYLIKDDEKYVAIDAGKDLYVVAAELKKLNIAPDKVVAVFLTHSDMDHVAALPLLKTAKIYMAANEVKMLNGEKQKIPFYNNSLPRTDYVPLADRQVVTVGNIRIYPILTEGHTAGSMCYQVNGKYLFTGDILSLHNGKIGPSVEFFDLDHKMAGSAISKVTGLPEVEHILTSHFGVASDYKNAVKDWKN